MFKLSDVKIVKYNGSLYKVRYLLNDNRLINIDILNTSIQGIFVDNILAFNPLTTKLSFSIPFYLFKILNNIGNKEIIRSEKTNIIVEPFNEIEINYIQFNSVIKSNNWADMLKFINKNIGEWNRYNISCACLLFWKIESGKKKKKWDFVGLVSKIDIYIKY